MSRLQDVYKLQCFIFNKAFNPGNKRIGEKVLREPLKGALMCDYYYPSVKGLKPSIINKESNSELNCYDPVEDYRVQRVEYLKRKGKGAPKKSKEKKVEVKKKK